MGVNGEAEERRAGCAPKFFSFLYNTLPPTAHSYSHTHSLSNLKAGQLRKLRPCGCVTHSVSLLLRRTVLEFPEPKSGKFYRQIAKLPAAVVLIVESYPKVVSNSNSNKQTNAI